MYEELPNQITNRKKTVSVHILTSERGHRKNLLLGLDVLPRKTKLIFEKYFLFEKLF